MKMKTEEEKIRDKVCNAVEKLSKVEGFIMSCGMLAQHQVKGQYETNPFSKEIWQLAMDVKVVSRLIVEIFRDVYPVKHNEKGEVIN